MDFAQISLNQHKKFGGKIEIKTKVSLKNKNDMSTFYTPGVAEPCKAIAKDKSASFELTWRKNTIAIVTDGSAVLGLGNIGPEAALPVMEGKAAIFKTFANVDAVPICLNTQNTEEIIKIVKSLEPTFGGVNLEDISAPRCFEIEERLKNEMNIPIFHDDQHGTAIVTLAALLNALKVVEKKIENIKIVFSGAGSAGIATARLLMKAGARHIIMCDSKGCLHTSRDDLNAAKKSMLPLNIKNCQGRLSDTLLDADVFIGLSAPGVISGGDIKKMAKNAIIFAMANPTPEIMPEEAKSAGAMIVATGRSDFENQVNNAIVFPGIFRGALDIRAKAFTDEIFLKAASAIANLTANPKPEHILPDIFDKRIVNAVALAVKD